MIETTTVGLIQETQCQWFEPKRLRALLLTVDGAGSGIDADKLDGQEGAYYLPAASYTAADVLTKLLTVDGAGSGLDADLLDGVSSSGFLLATGATTGGTSQAQTFSNGIISSGSVSVWSTSGWSVGLKMAGQGSGIMWPKGAGATSRLIGVTGSGVFYFGKSAADDNSAAATYDVTINSAGDVTIVNKIGFYNTTPAARPAAYTQTYATADRTIAARTAAAITNNTGGTVSTTFAAITAGAAYAQADMTAVKNALASIADQFNKLRNDHLDTTQGLNSVIDDGQTLGLLQ